MNVFELLKNDHEKALNLFDELEGMQGEVRPDTGRESGGGVQQAEAGAGNPHDGGGGVLLFRSVLKEEESTSSTVLESHEEHHVAKLLLNEMDAMQKDGRWMAKLAVLRESVEHHIEEEEGELFEEARGVIDERKADEIGRRMAGMKKEQMAPASR